MNTLSVVMIVKNEEEMLGRCLESVKDADEIVIVDTGSEDKTKEVALKYTDKFYENEYVWNDNFGEARNFAKNKATGDWILSIDADEQLEEGGIAKIKETIEEAVALGRRSIDVNLNCATNSLFYPRIFKNDPDIFWKGAIHECINLSEKTKSDIKITYSYSPAHKNDPDRSLRILEKEVSENPKAIREVFYLGREYTYKKEWEKAIFWLRVYIERATWLPEKADAYYILAKSLWQLQRGDEAREACAKAILINSNFKAAIVLMSDMHWPKNKSRWLEFAEGATNEDVLFERGCTATNNKIKTCKDFLILGHPRSGTRYMSELFTNLGFPVGHEVYKDRGIASWLFAVESNNYPQFYFTETGEPSNCEHDSRGDFNYQNIIHVVRDPLKVIASTLYTEDVVEPSLEFRKRYLTLYGNAHTQATLSYLGWNKLIEAQNPTLTIKIEDAKDDVVEFLMDKNYLQKDIDRSRIVFPNKKCNSRKHKKVTIKELERKLTKNLMAELRLSAERYGYDLG